MEAGTITDRQREAYELHEANSDKTYSELGEMMSPPIKGGTFSNLINAAREALGQPRGDGGGGGRTSKPPSALDAIDEAISRVEGSVERASNKVESAKAAVTEMEDDEWAETFINAERERRAKAVTDAESTLETARDAVEGEVEKLRAVRDTLAADVESDDDADNE